MANKKININDITKDELINVKHIGESLATKIISIREESGPFKSLNDFYKKLLPEINRPTIDKFIMNFTTLNVDNSESAHDEISITITLKDVNLQNKDFCGYLLLIDCIEIKGTDKIFRQIVIQFNAVNKLIWNYNPDIATQNGYSLRVKSPTGYILKIGLNDQDPAEFEKSLLLDDQNFSSEIEIKTLEEPLVDLKDSEKASVLPIYATGRLLDFSGQRMMENIQIVFYGAIKENPTDADFFPIASVYTEKDGYFSIGYPIQSFTEAYAIIGIPETENVPIRLDPDHEDSLRFPRQIILVAKTPLKEETSDCDCKDLEFHRPKQVLEEYTYYTVVRTTEPEIKAKVLEEPTISLGELVTKFPVLENDVIAAVRSRFNYTNAFVTDRDNTGRFVLRAMSATNPEAASEINLDEIKFPVSLFKKSSSPNFALNKESILEILHQGLAHGLGKFISEKNETAPGRSQLSCQNGISWDKNPEIYQACTIAHGHLLQFKQEWIAGGYSIGDLLYSLPLAPNQKKRIVVFDWDRRESASRFEQTDYEEGLYNSLRRDRDLYEISKGILSEKIRGSSLALTAGYGSGAGAAGIISGIAGVVGSAFGIGGGASVASQSASRKATASSFQKLRDNTTQSAHAVRNQRSTVIQTVNQGERFEVQSEIIANYNHCHAMTVQYFEVLRHFKVGFRLANVQECLFIPLEITEFSMDKALRWREILSNTLIDRSLSEAFPAIDRIATNYKFSDMPEGSYADEDIEYLEGELYLRFKIAMPKDDLVEDLGKFNEANWHPIVSLLPWFNPLDFYNSYLKGQNRKERIFQKELAPRIAEAFVESLKFKINDQDLPLNATLVSNYRNNTPLRISLRQSGSIPDMPRKDADFFRIVSEDSVLPSESKIIITRGHIKYKTRHISEYLIRSGSINQDIFDNANIGINGLTDKENERPRDKDDMLKNQLISHLNYNLEYYHHAIWLNMNPDRRYMILDGIMAPCKADGRSVASVVDNNLIGIVGNCLVMPVVPGLHLDPTFEISEKGDQISLLDHYMGDPPEPLQLSIPTKGVFAEAVMGKCNSCEEIDETRFWRWHEVPSPDEPTEILPIDTSSRRAEPPDLTPSEFPAPIVNIQNAPAAPDPTGLGKVLELLGKSDAFRDLTGLTQNQINALSAMQSALQAAQNFGSQAASLYGMQMRNLDKTLKKINDSPNLTSDQKSELEKEAIKKAAGIEGPKSTAEEKELIETVSKNKVNYNSEKPNRERLEIKSQKDVAGKVSLDPIIDLESQNSAMKRTFFPDSNDISGTMTVEALVTDAPKNARFEWSVQEPSRLLIKSPDKKITEMVAGLPGVSSLHFKVFDVDGSLLKYASTWIGVPQFFVVRENTFLGDSTYDPEYGQTVDSSRQATPVPNADSFDGVLTELGLLSDKALIISKIKNLVQSDILVKQSSGELVGHNLRIIWQLGKNHDSIHSHIVNNNYHTEINILGYPPRVIATPPQVQLLIGRTNPGPASTDVNGPQNPNETIAIFPGTFELSSLTSISPSDPDAGKLNDILNTIITTFKANPTDVSLKDNLIESFSRIISDTISHEIYHSVKLHKYDSNKKVIDPGFDSEGHTLPPLVHDKMSNIRSHEDRTGIEVDVTAYPSSGSFTIHGASLPLNSENSSKISVYFPVPPDPPFYN